MRAWLTELVTWWRHRRRVREERRRARRDYVAWARSRGVTPGEPVDGLVIRLRKG